MMGARLLCAALQIKNPRAVAKACEYERLADVRSQGSLGAYEPMKPAVCVELGCRHAGVSIVRAALCKTASCSEKAYSAAFRTIANLLSVTVGSTMAELGVKFGVMSIVPRAEKSLEEFQRRVFARDRTQAVGPVFVAAAIYQTAKKMRLKVDRERLVKTEDLDDALFGRAIELMLLVAFDLFAGDKDVKPKSEDGSDGEDGAKAKIPAGAASAKTGSVGHAGVSSNSNQRTGSGAAAARTEGSISSGAKACAPGSSACDAKANGGAIDPNTGRNEKASTGVLATLEGGILGAQSASDEDPRAVDLVPATERKRPRASEAGAPEANATAGRSASQLASPMSKKVARHGAQGGRDVDRIGMGMGVGQGEDEGEGEGEGEGVGEGEGEGECDNDDDGDDDGSGSSGLGAARAEGLPLPAKKLSKAEEFERWKRKILEEAKAKKMLATSTAAAATAGPGQERGGEPAPSPVLKQASIASFFQRPTQNS